ncbi:MAG TPA: type VI secretion system tip protein TssI/VgrG, partial [Polyangiaceae bacterium]|nr:type VI secretion system tip protein TssI/VgrG [Polyangiaceae bacterium]
MAVVVRASVRAYGEDAIELACATLPLALRASPRRFRDATVREIVDKVLAAVEMRAAWSLAEEPAPVPYVVQSGENDLAFVTRLLAAHGAYFFVDDEGRLAICDSSPDASMACTMPLLTTEEAIAREPGVRELFVGARVAAGRATVADYDWKKPLLALRESRDGDRDTDLEHYMWPAGFYDQAAGERLALKRLQGLRAHADYAEGRSNVPELGAGRRFTVIDEGEWFAVEVEHRFSAEQGYENRFFATPRAHPYRPPLERAPAVGGLESAMACGPAGTDIHTDAHGRFKAEMPWDADAAQTDEGARWVRLLQECSTSMFLARSGWEMLLAYVDGDPARPIGIGRAMHAGMAPSYAQPAFQGAMTVRTRSSPQDDGGGSELCISDDAGGQRIELVAQRDVATTVKHDQSVTIGRDATEKVGGERTLVVRGDRILDIGGDLRRHVHGDLQEAVKGSMKRSVAASESVAVKSAHKETITGADSERVSVLRMTLDGGVGSPADIVKNLVPPPKQALAGVLAAPVEQLTSGVGQVVGAATAPLGVVTGAMGTAGAAVAAGGAVLSSASLENVQGLKSSAESLASLPAQIGELKNAVTGLAQLPDKIANLPGSFDIGDAFKSARDRLSGTLKGVLSDLPMLAGALAVGEISKKAAGRYSRRVGG